MYFALVVYTVTSLVLFSIALDRDLPLEYLGRYLLVVGGIFLIIRFTNDKTPKYSLFDGALLLVIPLGMYMLLTRTLPSWVVYLFLFVVFARGFKCVLFNLIFCFAMTSDIFFTDIFTMSRIFLSLIPSLLVHQALSQLGIGDFEIIVLSVVLGAPAIGAYEIVWKFLFGSNLAPMLSSEANYSYFSVVAVVSFSISILLGVRTLASRGLESRAAKVALPCKERRSAIKRVVDFLSPVAVLLWMHALLAHALHRNPTVWLLEMLLRHQQLALRFSTYWLMTIFAVVFVTLPRPPIPLAPPDRSTNESTSSTVGFEASSKAQIIKNRKFFHALAVLLFAPPLLFAESDMIGFLSLALFGALCGFFAIEITRCFLFPDFFCAVTSYFNRFVNERDKLIKRGVILSHVYLLLGCAMPVWIYSFTAGEFLSQSRAASASAAESGYSPHGGVWASRLIRLLPHLGWITVGVGDAVAAVVGVSIVRPHLWGSQKGNKRTVEGTSAGLLATFLAALSALYVLAWWSCDGLTTSCSSAPESVSVLEILIVGIVAVVSAFCEAFCHHNDNLLVPIVACAALLSCISLASPYLPRQSYHEPLSNSSNFYSD